MKRIVIVSGGSPAEWPEMADYYDEKTFWIGVDRGAWFLFQKGIAVDLAVGDFDSMSEHEFQELATYAKKIIKAPAEKDETDTQLALSLAGEVSQTAPIVLIGGTGGRMDHLLANVWLMSEPRFGSLISRFSIRDKQNTLTFYHPGSYTVTKERDKTYIGFMCMTPVKDLTLKEFKYPLVSYDVTYPMSFASNEFMAETGTFSFNSGQVAVIQSKDK